MPLYPAKARQAICRLVRRNIQASLMLVLAPILLTSCFGSGPRAPEATSDRDYAEMAPGSLEIQVAEYNWAYQGDGEFIRVVGKVVNQTGSPIQAVRLTGALYDQSGRSLTIGDCFVTPTYLPAGAIGNFEFLGRASRKRGVTFTRLITSAHSNAL
jgi:hypothetical protein